MSMHPSNQRKAGRENFTAIHCSSRQRDTASQGVVAVTCSASGGNHSPSEGVHMRQHRPTSLVLAVHSRCSRTAARAARPRGVRATAGRRSARRRPAMSAARRATEVNPSTRTRRVVVDDRDDHERGNLVNAGNARFLARHNPRQTSVANLQSPIMRTATCWSTRTQRAGDDGRTSSRGASRRGLRRGRMGVIEPGRRAATLGFVHRETATPD